MSVQATCFHCQHPNSFPDKWAGKVMRCQKCGGILTLPKLDSPAAPPANLSEISQGHAPASPPATPRPATPPAARPLPRERAMTSDKSSPANRPPLSAGEPCAPGACALAVTLCTANALVMLLTATSALLIALPGTRALLQEKLNLTTNPYTVAPMAGGLAIVTALLAGFFIYCATQMRRSPAFARAAAWGAMTQTALQIAMLIYMTMHGQLNHITLAVLTISLIVLCALIDLSTRAVRFPTAPAPILG